MSEDLARIVLWLSGAYLAAGAAFAAAFHALGLTRLDPAARGAGLAFRALITPGVVLLWPVMAWRWRAGGPAVVTDATRPSPRRLRATHRLLLQALAVAIPILIAIAIALRPVEAPRQRLPPALVTQGAR